MASTCIIRRAGSSYLCRTDDVKSTLTLSPREALPERLTYVDSGAPGTCPECVIIHLTEGREPKAKDAALAELLARVATETRGLPRAQETLVRYSQGVSAYMDDEPAGVFAF